MQKRREIEMSVLKNKIDFVLLVSVENANPNGDPLNGNRPRTNYDGFGEYANENEVSNLHVSCWGIKNGLVRKDFTHVCWYNK